MTATSNPPAELPALCAGCEGDFSQQLVLPRPPRTAKNFTALMKTKLDGQVQETYNTAAHALDPTLAADHKAPLPARLPDDVVTDAFLAALADKVGDASKAHLLTREQVQRVWGSRLGAKWTPALETKLTAQVQETYDADARTRDPTLAADYEAPLPAKLPDYETVLPPPSPPRDRFADSSPPPSSSRPRFGGVARDF
jgi:hypothetical protein